MAKRQLTLFGTDAGSSSIYTKKPKNNFEVFMNKYMRLSDTGNKTRETMVNEGIICWNNTYKGMFSSCSCVYQFVQKLYFLPSLVQISIYVFSTLVEGRLGIVGSW